MELNNDSLKPTDNQLMPIKDEDWWKALKPHFDDLLWLYYSDRVVFINEKFRKNMTDAETITNIIRSFAIFLKSKNYTFSKLYETTVLEYNPLWNVDGVEGHIVENSGDAVSINKKTGSDGLNRNISGSDTRRGTNEKDINTSSRDGGQNNHTNSGTTFDSGGNFLARERDVDTFGKTNTGSESEDGSFTENGTKTERVTDTNTYNSQNKVTDTNENHTLEMTIRQGNIGVTKSTDLIDSQRETVLFDFFKYVVRMCVNVVTYAID